MCGSWNGEWGDLPKPSEISEKTRDSSMFAINNTRRRNTSGHIIPSLMRQPWASDTHEHAPVAAGDTPTELHEQPASDSAANQQESTTRCSEHRHRDQGATERAQQFDRKKVIYKISDTRFAFYCTAKSAPTVVDSRPRARPRDS
jgi:hypothetical protein